MKATDAFAVTVYCSANPDLAPSIVTAARDFSRGLAKRRWELIYGGASIGLMGVFADECLQSGGVVRGAITQSLAAGPEVAHRGLTELVIVEDLFERKRWMMDACDAVVIFPGGFGTLDEALEAITWKSLKCFSKPILFVNLDGFWQATLDAFADLAGRGVIRSGGLALYEVCDSIDGVWRSLDESFRE